MATARARKATSPRDLAEAAKAAHEALIEMVAEGNDELLEEFFDKGTLPAEHIMDGLRDAVRQRRMFPVLCASGSAQHRHRPASEFHRSSTSPPRRPRPLERHAQRQGSRARGQGHRAALAFVFKTVADPFAGRVSYFKVVSGVLKNDANLVERAQQRRRAAGAHRRAVRARPSSPCPNCMRAISAAWRN